MLEPDFFSEPEPEPLFDAGDLEPDLEPEPDLDLAVPESDPEPDFDLDFDLDLDLLCLLPSDSLPLDSLQW